MGSFLSVPDLIRIGALPDYQEFAYGGKKVMFLTAEHLAHFFESRSLEKVMEYEFIFCFCLPRFMLDTDSLFNLARSKEDKNTDGAVSARLMLSYIPSTSQDVFNATADQWRSIIKSRLDEQKACILSLSRKDYLGFYRHSERSNVTRSPGYSMTSSIRDRLIM